MTQRKTVRQRRYVFNSKSNWSGVYWTFPSSSDWLATSARTKRVLICANCQKGLGTCNLSEETSVSVNTCPPPKRCPNQKVVQKGRDSSPTSIHLCKKVSWGCSLPLLKCCRSPSDGSQFIKLDNETPRNSFTWDAVQRKRVPFLHKWWINHRIQIAVPESFQTSSDAVVALLRLRPNTAQDVTVFVFFWFVFKQDSVFANWTPQQKGESPKTEAVAGQGCQTYARGSLFRLLLSAQGEMSH